METALESSLEIMKKLNMNIPEILIWNKDPKDEQERTMNKIHLKANAMRIHTRVVIPSQSYEPMSSGEYLLFSETYDGGPCIVFKYPKTEPLIVGYCEPHLWTNKIQLNNSEVYPVIWGDSALLPFPAGLRKAVGDLNTMLSRGRHELSGMKIRFTFHSQGEGLRRDRIVLWGKAIG